MPVTDAGQASERLRLLWRWMNAYALAGGAVPVDFPQQYVVEMLGVRAVSGKPEDAVIAAKKADTQAFLSEVDNIKVADLDDPSAVLQSVSRFRRSLCSGAVRERWTRQGAGPDHDRGAGRTAACRRADATGRDLDGRRLPMQPGGGLVLMGAGGSGRGIAVADDRPRG